MSLLNRASVTLRNQAPGGAFGRARGFTTSTARQNANPVRCVVDTCEGEIAIRIMKTAKKMGIKTVAVFSDADRHSLFVRMADEAVHIGPAPTNQSYLVPSKIIDAAKKTGADAIHPGYGFLSENNHFVDECDKNGIVFIGPSTSAMDALGDKIHSKKVAKDAGVSIVPGFIGEIDNLEHLLKITNEVGYPVMIKASSGGGGKGQRIAYNDEEAKEGFRLCKMEAISSFGDDRLLVEKFIESPRHIEFQVLADGKGGAVYLPERECSIQRRNQKVIEEAPSPFITPDVRKKMGEQAVALAKAVGYKNTGTCEFLVDAKSNFFFLEMNTRLQVEHPITEQITGIDIVEHMIRIAAGEKLALSQTDIKINGWAMESRVYAEDPLRNFLPSIGRLTRYKEPVPYDGGNWIRSDSGIVEGSEISIYYDPLISKLVTWGETRIKSIDRMAYALDSYVVRGLNHNVCFLRDVMDNKTFRSGNLTTNFIPDEYPTGFKGHQLSSHEHTNLMAVTAAVNHLLAHRNASVSGKLGSFNTENRPQEYRLGFVGDKSNEYLPVSSIRHEGRTVRVHINDKVVDVDLSAWPLDGPVVLAQLESEGKREEVIMQLISKIDLGFKIQYVGSNYDINVLSPLEADLIKHVPVLTAADSSNKVTSPMAGQLVSIAVKVGDQVAIGQEICIVEAMKMQNILRAERDGVIKAIKAEAGKPVALDQIIVEFQ